MRDDTRQHQAYFFSRFTTTPFYRLRHSGVNQEKSMSLKPFPLCIELGKNWLEKFRRRYPLGASV